MSNFNLSKKIYIKLVLLGNYCGCHRMPERSFFFREYQFPVCARCTGGFIGYILGILLHFLVGTNILYCLFACFVMFADWFIQYLKIAESTNIRRLITGIFGGYGVMGLHIKLILFLFHMVK